jgi:hypothetical protein
VTFLFKQLFIDPLEAEWTPFQTHYLSEDLVAPGIETETSGSVAREAVGREHFMMLRDGTIDCRAEFLN